MQRWESIKKGFLLKAPDGYYIWGILSNGHPEKPVIYKTKNVWEAKYWRTLKGATESAARISSQVGKCEVLPFKYDEEQRARVITGEPLT